MAATKQRFAFRAEYHDRTADIIRPYTLLYFPGEDEIEMVDMKNKRTFLKRTKAPPGLSDQLFVGGKVEVFSRLLSIVGYADAYTEKNVAPAAAYTFAMIKPNAIIHLGEIIDRIYEEGFKIAHMDMHILAPHDCAEFYAEHAGKAFFESLSAFMCSGPSIAMKLVAENAVERWRRVIGPTDSNEAKQRAPESLRAKFGVNQTVNAVHGADSPDSARRECEFFFSGKHKFRPTARLGSEGTLCLVKPHAVREGNLGKIVAHIQSQGYSITALVMLTLDHTDADEFLEVYRGVLPEYPTLISEVTSGPCVAMEVCCPEGYQPVSDFRELCGPIDPAIAKALRPGTLRALYGHDKVKNSVHCTDLPEDGRLECEFFFTIVKHH